MCHLGGTNLIMQRTKERRRLSDTKRESRLTQFFNPHMLLIGVLLVLKPPEHRARDAVTECKYNSCTLTNDFISSSTWAALSVLDPTFDN